VFAPLRDIFHARLFFFDAYPQAVRVAALVSLAQLGTPEAMEIVRKAAADRLPAVRRMSGIILGLGSGKSVANAQEAS